MPKFSVLLLYPEPLRDEYPFETYYAWVKAPDVASAKRAAQAEAATCQSKRVGFDRFVVLGVWRGHQGYCHPNLGWLRPVPAL